jgi:hypothetical protein
MSEFDFLGADKLTRDGCVDKPENGMVKFRPTVVVTSDGDDEDVMLYWVNEGGVGEEDGGERVHQTTWPYVMLGGEQEEDNDIVLAACMLLARCTTSELQMKELPEEQLRQCQERMMQANQHKRQDEGTILALECVEDGNPFFVLMSSSVGSLDSFSSRSGKKRTFSEAEESGSSHQPRGAQVRVIDAYPEGVMLTDATALLGVTTSHHGRGQEHERNEDDDDDDVEEIVSNSSVEEEDEEEEYKPEVEEVEMQVAVPQAAGAAAGRGHIHPNTSSLVQPERVMDIPVGDRTMQRLEQEQDSFQRSRLVVPLLLDELKQAFFMRAPLNNEGEEEGEEEEEIVLRIAPQEYGGICIYNQVRGEWHPEVRIDPPMTQSRPWRMTLVHPAVDVRTGELLDIYGRRVTQPIVPCNTKLLGIFASQVFSTRGSVCMSAPDWREINVRQDTVLHARDWDTGAHVALKEFAEKGGVSVWISPPGTGKTHAVERFFCHHYMDIFHTSHNVWNRSPPKLVHIAARETLVHDLARRWRDTLRSPYAGNVVTCYDLKAARTVTEKEQLEANANVIVTTRDSLMTVKQPPDVFFVDEMQTIWREFNSDLMRPRVDSVLEHFQQLCGFATHVIFGDAYMSNRQQVFVSDVQQYRTWLGCHRDQSNDILLFRIKPLVPRRHLIFTLQNDNSLDSIMDDALAAYEKHPAGSREPVIVACQTKKAAEMLTHHLLEHNFPPDGLVTYTAMTVGDTHECYQIGRDGMNELLRQVAIFIHTPTIGPGLDLQTNVYRVYGWLSHYGLSGACGFLQMLYRARRVRHPIITTFIPADSITLLRSFSQNNIPAKSFREYAVMAWMRHLSLPSTWRSLIQNVLNKPYTQITVDEAVVAQMPISERMAYHLVLLRTMEEEEEKKYMGRRILSCICESGDTYTCTFLVRPEMLQSAGGLHGSIQPLSELIDRAKHAVNLGTAYRRNYTIPGGVVLQNRMQALVDQVSRMGVRVQDALDLQDAQQEADGGGFVLQPPADGDWLPLVVDSSRPEWFIVARTLSRLVQEKKATTNQAECVKEIKKMVDYGMVRARQFDIPRVEKHYRTTRNQLLWIDPYDTLDENVLKRHHERARGLESDATKGVLRSLWQEGNNAVDNAGGSFGGVVESNNTVQLIKNCEYMREWFAVLGFSRWSTVLDRQPPAVVSLAAITKNLSNSVWFRKNAAYISKQKNIFLTRCKPNDGVYTDAYAKALLLEPRWEMGIYVDEVKGDAVPQYCLGSNDKTVTILSCVRHFAAFHGLDEMPGRQLPNYDNDDDDVVMIAEQ